MLPAVKPTDSDTAISGVASLFQYEMSLKEVVLSNMK